MPDAIILKIPEPGKARRNKSNKAARAFRVTMLQTQHSSLSHEGIDVHDATGILDGLWWLWLLHAKAKILPENQKHFLSAEISSRLAQIGKIYPLNILSTGT